jgi:hypothetical protein
VVSKLQDLAQSDEVRKVLRDLDTAACTSLVLAIKGPSVVYMRDNYDHTCMYLSENAPADLVDPAKFDVSKLKNLHMRIVDHIAGANVIDLRDKREVVKLCKSRSASNCLQHTKYLVK